MYLTRLISYMIYPKTNFLVLLILGFLCLNERAFAQSNANTKVTGTVQDPDNAALPYASVGAFTLPDSQQVAGDVTNEEGKFTLSLKPGNYYFTIRFLSFQEKALPATIVSGDNVDLGTISMVAEDTELDAVVIEGEKSQMSFQLDKRVFNVGQDVNNAGRNASELLDNIPSVSVDVDGNVALRGSQNVRILIDGKPSGLVGLGSTDALRLMSGNMIERIEVITNPSARYDAEGEVGIINIVLKKEKQKGINGSFDLAVGYPHAHQAGLNLNFRKKWVNLFTNLSGSYRRGPGKGSGYSYFEFPDTAYSFLRTREHYRGGLGGNFNLGADFFLPAQQTITVSGLYKRSIGDNYSTITYTDFNILEEETGSSERIDDETESQDVIEAGLSYVKEFKQKDRKWTADFKFVQSDDTENSTILQTYTDGTADLQQRVSNTEDETTWFLQTDYVQPLGAKGRIETGIRTTLRNIENNYGVDQLAGGEWIPLNGFNNFFKYTENIYAGYLMAGNQTGKFSYQAGLRAEYSEIITELVNTQEVNPRDYLNLFPSGHLSYKPNIKNDIQLSYSRRIKRPDFRELLPFFGFSDNRVFFSGNPNLNPEYTNSFEAGYMRYLKSGSILSSIYYRHREGVIQRITEVDSTGFSTIFPVNIAQQNAFGVEFNVNVEPVKKWKLTGNFNFYRNITSGTYEGQDLSADAYTWTARVSSKTTLFKDVDFQATWDYRAPENTVQGRTLSQWALDLGANKDILKRKGTLTLSVKDLFNTRRRRWETVGANFYSTNDFQWRARQITLAFNYRLNQDKKKVEKRNSGGEDGGGGFD